MPFVETILFKEDLKKFKQISDSITSNLCKIFKTKKNLITIYNTAVDKKNFYHNSILGSKEKRIFIKIYGLKRNKHLKRKLASLILDNIQKLVNVKKPENIAIYFFDKEIDDIYHGKIK